ncbi:TadE family protein [Hyalangium sp.]|uniref:TadE/TadG family type IV pilus assembly protein n=1 Tax=Hyalangium sp. TaxID=2028555 RepID=UPI002D3A2B60|nr:TadE family protein [Hyalangium sp.]HYH99806.1 TadE family protein [Hyalangium sp.]
MKAPNSRRSGQSGQAAVEAALTLPLTVFLILGILQLFMMLQARVMAEYAAFRATRAGSVRHGDCEAMTHAAILALLPTFHSYLGNDLSGSPADKLGQAFGLRKNNQYTPGNRGYQDGKHSGSIVWIIRESPRGITDDEDLNFDEPRTAVMRLETRLVYWFPLKIPFANWVISRMVLAHWGLMNYTATNPLMPTQKARWKKSVAMTVSLDSAIVEEMLGRVSTEQYVIPIHASASLRMMTPAQGRYFRTFNCPPAPETL